jgi:predicted TIM-barrel fold metal-dependent hydrolase
MIIDVHGHLGRINQAPFWAADAAQLDAYLDEAGVDELWISSAKSLMYSAREGNAEMREALRTSRKLRGYVVLNPVCPESMEDIEMLREEKFLGVKIHPDYHGYDALSPRVRPFLDEVARRTPLILTHISCMPGTAFSEGSKLLEFASRHPETNFIFAHIGGIFQDGLYPYFPNFEGLEKIAAANLKNVYVDTSHHLMYVYPGVMQQVEDIFGVDRLLFGTDMPLQGPMQARFAIEAIRALAIPEEDKNKILFANAQTLSRKPRE